MGGGVLCDLIRGLSSLCPVSMADAAMEKTMKGRFKVCLDTLQDANQISTTEYDRAEIQYRALLSSANAKRKLTDFDESEDRIDALFSELLKSDNNMKEIWKCVKVKNGG